MKYTIIQLQLDPRDNPREYRLTVDSVADVRAWAKFNARVLGEPHVRAPVYKVEHSDGSLLSEEELKAIQPETSEDLHRRWQIEAYEYLGMRYTEADIQTLWCGVATAAVFNSGVLANTPA